MQDMITELQTSRKVKRARTLFSTSRNEQGEMVVDIASPVIDKDDREITPSDYQVSRKDHCSKQELESHIAQYGLLVKDLIAPLTSQAAGVQMPSLIPQVEIDSLYAKKTKAIVLDTWAAEQLTKIRSDLDKLDTIEVIHAQWDKLVEEKFSPSRKFDVQFMNNCLELIVATEQATRVVAALEDTW
ncbi:hypothetical protein SUGI_1201270 [Cryptomeria japonica]|nr:hypothetical protein SUGI_1201270 [Cryptomeria japonica]